MDGDLRRARKPIAAVAALFLLVLLAIACAAYRQQHAGERRTASAPAAPPPVAAAPADFQALPATEQGARLRGEVAEAKSNLEKDGKYRCCVRPTCNECLLKRGECHCRDVAAKKGPCCGECTEAWIEGHGAIEGLDALELLRRKESMLNEKQ